MDVKSIVANFLPCSGYALANTTRGANLPGASAVAATLRRIFDLFYPGCFAFSPVAHEKCHEHVERNLEKIAEEIEDQIARFSGNAEGAKALAERFMAELPKIRATLEEDITAAYEGDPAATSRMEVVMAYPGLLAITVHRVAHALYELKVPTLPRIMGEIAHARTGIDIHPGATIGGRFFIDHGTGVVIGETTVIGRNVKLYQGVTLGAPGREPVPVPGADDHR